MSYEEYKEKFDELTRESTIGELLDLIGDVDYDDHTFRFPHYIEVYADGGGFLLTKFDGELEVPIDIDGN